MSRALREHDSVTVDLDGTTGFGSSFLDEVFGGLVRNEGFRLDDLQKRLHIISVLDASYKVEAWESIREAEQFVAASKRPA
ncbi:MAG: STAS-like domain-containing protein [Xanthobacteraceae bacterium]|nr:STAS-like domain-containing protein [Xanthobacteraceae bacterium]